MKIPPDEIETNDLINELIDRIDCCDILHKKGYKVPTK